MPAAVTYTFSPGTQIESAKVNQNFDDLVVYTNGNVVLKDGSVAFTGLVTGPAADPTTANHLARKAYVDGKVGLLKSFVKNSDSNATTTAVTDLGIDMDDWTMPTIANGRCVRIALYWPYSVLTSNPAEGGDAAEIWIRINGANQEVRMLPITTTGFFPRKNTGGTAEMLITTNTTYPAGTTMTCKVMGRRETNDGHVKLGGDASNSIFYYAHII